MKNKYINKFFSVLLAVALLCTSAMPIFANDGGSSSTSKEEVVYVNITADGKVKDVYVVNIFSGGNIVDYGDYSEIKNLNTSDRITKNGNKITFSSSADRVYYQGKLTNPEIPWNISIRYFIDGTEYSPETAAGKSGTEAGIERDACGSLENTHGERAKGGYVLLL